MFNRSMRSLMCVGLLIVLKTFAADAPNAKPDRFDKIVDDFILYDIGRLPGPAGQRAYQEFVGMSGDECIPALVRGVNKAARIQNSCPIIVLAGKLQTILQTTRNRDMLEYAFKNLNNSGNNVIYGDYVLSLKEAVDSRITAVSGEASRVKREMRAGTPSQLRRMSVPLDQWTRDDLAEGVLQEKDAQLVRVLEQLKDRKGTEYTAALGEAVAQVKDDVKPLARGLLAQRMARMTDKTLQAALKSSDVEIRAAAARAIGYKGSTLLKELAEAMRDPQPLVAKNAHASLVKLLGDDLGPPENATSAEWFAASRRWEKRVAEQPQQ